MHACDRPLVCVYVPAGLWEFVCLSVLGSVCACVCVWVCVCVWWSRPLREVKRSSPRPGGRSPLSRNTLILIQRATAERGEVREMKDRRKIGGPNEGEQKWAGTLVVSERGSRTGLVQDGLTQRWASGWLVQGSHAHEHLKWYFETETVCLYTWFDRSHTVKKKMFHCIWHKRCPLDSHIIARKALKELLESGFLLTNHILIH